MFCCAFRVCDEKERELGRKQATGACPFCDGKVEAVDVESTWRLCFLPLGFVVKRRYVCTKCARRLSGTRSAIIYHRKNKDFEGSIIEN
ncbi:hypothetical protein ACJIZ3_021660 [Penstemon smallii]|uniref:Uncharacterized protein n=1 Tax=Penstemon smallii TaxID=265156 RepID=A0ABD3SML5_9LAMI